MSKRENKAHQHLASGALSGLASSVILQPLDLVKTRQQQGVQAGHGVVDNVKGKGRAILPTARLVIQEDGWRGLWRGTAPTVARNVPGVAAYFYLLSEIRFALSFTSVFAQTPPSTSLLPTFASNALAPSSSSSSSSSSSPSSSLTPAAQTRNKSSALPKLTSQGNMVAGAVARTTIGFILNPITVLKSRFESGLYDTKSIASSFRQLLATDGLRGMFQGFTATAARDAPYAGIYMAFYEKSKDLMSLSTQRTGLGVPTAMVHTISGMSAATLATLVTSPADCVKTRMQVLPTANPTIRAAMSSIWTERGFQGFFAGSILRITRKAASSAIAWTVYEGLLLMFRDQQRNVV